MHIIYFYCITRKYWKNLETIAYNSLVFLLDKHTI